MSSNVRKSKEFVGRRQIYRRVANALNGISLASGSIETSLEESPDSEENDNGSSSLQFQHEIVSNETDCQTEEYNCFSNSHFSIDTGIDNFNILNNQNENGSPSGDLGEHIDPDSDSLNDSVRKWAIEYNVSRVAVSKILKIFSPFHSNLPLDSRTLLKTPVSKKIERLGDGEFHYLGLKNGLKTCILLNWEKCIPLNSLDLSFNIDGLPLFHSNNIQVWPILCLIKTFKCAPFAVAIFCGISKPKPLHLFLEYFLNDLSVLLAEGFTLNEKRFNVNFHSFVCDAPARAFIKCVKQHGGYSSCEKCTEPGEYHGRVIFKNISAIKRTNESFRRQLDEDHHTGASPLLTLPINLVNGFPIDYMHNVCLGVMKKMLNTWISGTLKVRLRSYSVNLISENLVSLKSCIPVEFNRKPRTLNELARWKATEYRTFLLYIGPIVLKNVVDIAVYEHFLLLHCAITILLSQEHFKNFGSVAKTFLETFVLHSERLYGIEFLVYNVHLLCHLTDDVKNFGSLDNFSSFPFENYLGQLKKLVKKPTKPLQQIINRLHEINSAAVETPHLAENIELLLGHNLGPTPRLLDVFKQYKTVKLPDITISICSHSIADCYCLSTNKEIVKVYNIIQLNNSEIMIYGRKFLTYSSLYKYPLYSSHLQINAIKNVSTTLELWPLRSILAKCVVLKVNQNEWASVPLIHSL